MPNLQIPASREQFTDLKSGLITHNWYRFLFDLMVGVMNSSDFLLNVSLGLVRGYSSNNTSGRAPDGMQTTATDIWGRADSSATQQIWLAPTAARVHAIVSTSASDDGSPVGVGARTVTVYGLTSWSTAESSETVTLNGVGSVNTASSYVMINRIVVATFGASGPNVGTITATAAVDGTITAVVLPGRGQSEQAIYGVPSTQKLCVTNWLVGMNDFSATGRVNFKLLLNPNPANFPTVFLTKAELQLYTDGEGTVQRQFSPPMVLDGPLIIKVQGLSNVADVDCTSSFGAVLVDN